MSVSTSNPAEGVRWDLSAFFSCMEDPKLDEAWSAAHMAADRFAAQYRGKVAQLTATQLAQAIQAQEDLAVAVSKPVIYANLLFAADTSDPKHGAFLQAQSEKVSEVRVKTMFFELELMDIEDDAIQSLLVDPALDNYRHYLNVVRVYRPHKLTETEEVLLEEVANVGSRAWVRLHEEITANQLFQYTNPSTGEVEELSEEEVLDLLRDPSREVRQAAADSFSEGLKQIERVVVFTYNTLLADKKLEDRLREHPYPEHSRHLSNEMDKQTVDLVMSLCKEKGDLVARYYRVKREILGLPELTHIDRYAPLFEFVQRVSWEEAKSMVQESFAAFSPMMAQKSLEFFDRNWIDAETRPGKSGGAFCSFNTPDTHPVMLMSFLGKLDDVMTLAHELGHGVHASLARKQTYYNMGGTLPLAELASIFGEMLVFERVAQQADKKEKLALYANKIEGVFASVYRQSAMFRFEQRCHEFRRIHGELSPEQFGELWQEELQAMFGDSLKLDEQHRLWWSYVSHFFFAPFYVYAYSFGELLTLALFQMSKEVGPEFAETYLDVLSQGGSKTPQELMGQLGVDLSSQEFWEQGFRAIEHLVGEFERLWSDR